MGERTNPMDISLSNDGEPIHYDKYSHFGGGDLTLLTYADSSSDLAIADLPLSVLIRRAILTPYGYLSEVVYPDLVSVDATYGDQVYGDLSEPLDTTLLSLIRSHVEEALSFVDVTVTSMELWVDEQYGVHVSVEYVDEQGSPVSAVLTI